MHTDIDPIRLYNERLLNPHKAAQEDLQASVAQTKFKADFASELSFAMNISCWRVKVMGLKNNATHTMISYIIPADNGDFSNSPACAGKNTTNQLQGAAPPAGRNAGRSNRPNGPALMTCSGSDAAPYKARAKPSLCHDNELSPPAAMQVMTGADASGYASLKSGVYSPDPAQSIGSTVVLAIFFSVAAIRF